MRIDELNLHLIAAPVLTPAPEQVLLDAARAYVDTRAAVGQIETSDALQEAAARVAATSRLLQAAVASAYAAGVRSVGRLIEDSTTVDYQSTFWYADNDTDSFGHYAPDPEGHREHVLEWAESRVNDPEWDYVRAEVRSLQRRIYHANEQVIGSFARSAELAHVAG